MRSSPWNSSKGGTLIAAQDCRSKAAVGPRPQTVAMLRLARAKSIHCEKVTLPASGFKLRRRPVPALPSISIFGQATHGFFTWKLFLRIVIERDELVATLLTILDGPPLEGELMGVFAQIVANPDGHMHICGTLSIHIGFVSFSFSFSFSISISANLCTMTA